MTPPHAPRILVVEDHPLIADLVETRLRIEGMAPVVCTGGREALAVLATQRFDAAILDVMMPDVDGHAVLAHIRATPATASLPVLVLTAMASPADVEKGYALGADHYLTKPFSGLDLVRRLRECLERGRPAAAAG
jgi:DNA-binding response OmpR family regulator